MESTVVKAETEESRASAMKLTYAPLITFYEGKEQDVKLLIDKPLDKKTAKECYELRIELKNKRLESVKEIKPAIDKANIQLKAIKAVSTNVDFLSKHLEEQLSAKETEWSDKVENEKILLHAARKEALEIAGALTIGTELNKMSDIGFKALLMSTENETAERLEKERIAKEAADKVIADEAAEKKRLKDANDKLEAEAVKFQKEKKGLEDKVKKLEKDENDRKKEKERVDKIETDRLQKVKDDIQSALDKTKAEQLVVEQNIAAEKRAEELKPEKEKIANWIETISIDVIDTSNFSPESLSVCQDISKKIEDLIIDAKAQNELIK
jgi:hypothetical protein